MRASCDDWSSVSSRLLIPVGRADVSFQASSAESTSVSDVVFVVALFTHILVQASISSLHSKPPSNQTQRELTAFDSSIDLSPSTLHVRRRIWQETVSVLLLTSADCKIPPTQPMEFVLHREHPWPPYLHNFQGTPAERHVENLKVCSTCYALVCSAFLLRISDARRSCAKSVGLHTRRP